MNKMRSFFDISEKVVVVTGAAGQLGGEYVKTFLAAGGLVAAFDINLNNPKGILKDISSKNLLLCKVDISKRASVEKGLKKVLDHLGRPEILINNAAIDAPPNAPEEETGPFETYPESSWDRIMKINLGGMVICSQVIGGHMAEAGGGAIINISSIYGILSPDQRLYEYREKPFYKPVSYAVSKAGVINLTRYLATYWAGRNVRVNTLTLGGVYNNQDERFLKRFTAKVPLRRMANQNEFNGAVLFLASSASSYMTGANLIIDGGFSAW